MAEINVKKFEHTSGKCTLPESDSDSSDSTEFYSALEHVGDDFQDGGVETGGVSPLSTQGSSYGGSETEGWSIASELDAVVNPSEASSSLCSLPPRPFLQQGLGTSASHMQSVSGSSYDHLRMHNELPSLSSYMSETTTEEAHETEDIDSVPLESFGTHDMTDECLFEDKNVDKGTTLLKERFGFQRLRSPWRSASEHRINVPSKPAEDKLGRPFLGKDARLYDEQPDKADCVQQPMRQEKQHKIKQTVTIGCSPKLGSAFKPINMPTRIEELKSEPRFVDKHTDNNAAKMVKDGPFGQDSATVEIRGLAKNTMKETIRYYFENLRRSGGGKITDLRWDRTTGRCLLSFASKEVAERVLARHHTLDSRKLAVRLHNPQRSSQQDSTADQARVLCVEEFDIPTTTEDALRNHFENPRFGGGEVLAVQIGSHVGNRHVAFVTFLNAEDAQQAASKPHKLNGKTLRVSQHRPGPAQDSVFSVHGLQSCVVAEDLLHFLEACISCDIYDILFGTEPGVAVVVFTDIIELDTVQSSLRGKIFMGAQLTAQSVPVYRSVEVRRLPSVPSLSEETLANYFRNTSRSGGSDVTHVHLSDDRQSAVVTFEDPEVCITVASKAHLFHNTELDVRPHFECLGLLSGLPHSPLDLPPPLHISEPHLTKVLHLMHCPTMFCALENTLASCHAALLDQRPDKPVLLKCTLSPDVPEASSIANRWAKDVLNLLVEHLNSLLEETVAIKENAYAAVETQLEQMAEELEICFFFNKELEQATFLTQQSTSSSDIDDMKNLMIEAEQNLHKQHTKKAARIELSRGRQLLLKKHGVGKDILQKFPNLRLIFKPDEAFIELRGSDNELTEMKSSLQEAHNVIRTESYTWPSPQVSQLMTEHEARKVVENACLREDPDGCVDFEDHGFFVHTFDIDKSSTMLKRGVSCLQQLTNELDSKSRVDLFNLKEEAFQQNAVGEYTFQLQKPFAAVIQNFLRNQHQDHSIAVTSIQFDTSGTQVTVSGNEEGVRATELLLNTMDQQK